MNRIDEKLFKLLHLQGQIIYVNSESRNKMHNLHNKFGKDTWKNFSSYRDHK